MELAQILFMDVCTFCLILPDYNWALNDTVPNLLSEHNKLIARRLMQLKTICDLKLLDIL